MFRLGFIFLLFTSFCQSNIGQKTTVVKPDVIQSELMADIQVAAQRTEAYFPLLKGKKVALCINHTATLGAVHLLDTLMAVGINVQKVFAPEHGFRGEADAGESIKDGKDSQSGVSVQSLYGKKKRPSQADLAGIDIVVFDIQDVGARFYTYISTLYYLMDACAEYGVEIIVLDRPNPNGHYIDGPVLEKSMTSFVGIVPIPIVHGCTVGELAQMYKGEQWLPSGKTPKLTVIPCANYRHAMPYDLPIAPSPNLPNQRAIYLYPSLCLFEGTTFSVGRGTQRQFQVFGHPDITGFNTQFRPKSGDGSKYPPQEGKICKGTDFSFTEPQEFFAEKKLNLSYLIAAYQAMPDKNAFFLDSGFFDTLAGTKKLRQQLEAGMSESEMRATWKADLDAYKSMREKYLLYE